MKNLNLLEMENITGSGENEDAFIAGLTCGAALLLPFGGGYAKWFGRSIPIVSCINYIATH